MLNQDQITHACQLLLNNQVIILPTDTIYGLSAIVNKHHKELINQYKQAPSTKPIIILITQAQHLVTLNIIKTIKFETLCTNQPTTFIVATQNFTTTLALRVIRRPDLKMIIDKVGPIYSSSVNQHNTPPLINQSQLIQFDPEIKVFWDGALSTHGASKIYNTITNQWIR